MPTMAPTRAPTPIPVITAPVVVHRTPTVYIHIGPHKTASSYIQNIIDAYKGPLSWQKYCWPGENGKSFHPFAMALQSNQNISSEFLDRFDACRRKQNKIIISTESFCIISPDAVGRLREMFANDTVRILVTYRNWLSRYYSIYTEIAKKNLHYLQPFSQFALRYEQEIAEKTGMDLVSMLRPWEEHFGRDALSIVDYDGVLAAGKDIGLVYLCEMLKLNCDKIRKDPTDFNQLVNKTPDMMAFDLLSLVRYLANFKYGCVPNPPKTDSYWVRMVCRPSKM